VKCLWHVHQTEVYVCIVSFLIPLLFLLLLLSSSKVSLSFPSTSHSLTLSLSLTFFAFIFSHQSCTNPRRWGLPASNLLDYQNQNLFYSAKTLASQSPRCGPGRPCTAPVWRIIARSCRIYNRPLFYINMTTYCRLNVSFIYTPWLIDFFGAIDVPFEPRITNDTCSHHKIPMPLIFPRKTASYWCHIAYIIII